MPLFDTAWAAVPWRGAPQACARCSCPSRTTRPRWRGCCAPAALVMQAAPPPDAAAAIQGIQALLQGHKLDLREGGAGHDPGVGLSPACMPSPAPYRPAKVRTYGDIAEQLGSKGLARAVGQALGLNPFAPGGALPPGAGGEGFRRAASPPPAVGHKLRMLQIEGACWGDTQAAAWLFEIAATGAPKEKPDGRKAHRAFFSIFWSG